MLIVSLFIHIFSILSFVSLPPCLCPFLQKLTTSLNTWITSWPMLLPRSPNGMLKDWAGSRLWPLKPRRWWLWWTKLRISMCTVSGSIIWNFIPITSAFMCSGNQHLEITLTDYSLFCFLDVNMYLPTKLFRSSQPSLNLNLPDSSAQQETQVDLVFIYSDVWNRCVTTLTPSIYSSISLSAKGSRGAGLNRERHPQRC